MKNDDVRPGYLVIERGLDGNVKRLGRVSRVVSLFGTLWMSYSSGGRTYYGRLDDEAYTFASPADD